MDKTGTICRQEDDSLGYFVGRKIWPERSPRQRSEPWTCRNESKMCTSLDTVVAVEEAFKNLKGDLAVRPVFHQSEQRVEAHIFVSFLAYCLHVTLGQRLRSLAPGLTTRSVLEQFAAMQMIDVHLPTTDARHIILTRTTQPQPELRLLLDKLKLQLPAQPPPKISAAQANSTTAL